VGVEGLDVSSSFGRAVWADAAGTAAMWNATKPKEINRILKSDRGPR